MSPVLRPGRVTSKGNEGIIINNSDVAIDSEEVLPTSIPAVELVDDILLKEVKSPSPPHEEVPSLDDHMEVVAVTQKEEVKTKDGVQEEEKIKEEKISAVLQKLLDRKINIAIENAEASLVAQTPEIIDDSLLVSPTTTETIALEVDVPAAETCTEPVLVSSSPEVTPILQQETYIPILQEDIHPSTKVAVETITVAQEQEVPPPHTVNIIPITIVKQEVTTSPNIPVETLTITSHVPAQSVAPAATTPIAAVVVPKVSWFDKLFGSAPKTPPQSV